jgi:hypothetical protein
MDDTARLVWRPIQLSTLLAAAFGLDNLGWQPRTAFVTALGAAAGAAIGVTRVCVRRRNGIASPIERERVR